MTDLSGSLSVSPLLASPISTTWTQGASYTTGDKVHATSTRSGCTGLDRRYLRQPDVRVDHTAKTTYLYAIVVPELEETKWRCLSASYRAIPDHSL